MTMDDHQMGWKLKEIFIPGDEFNSVSPVDGVSLVVGGQHAELSDFGFGGIEMDASDGVAHIMRIPWDLDVTKEVFMRLHFASDSTDADTVDWDATYKFYAVGAAWVAATGDGTLAFDQVTMSTTAYLDTVTDWLPMLFTTNYAAGDYFLGIQIICTAFAGTADEMFFMGMDLAYTISALGAERQVTSV